MLKELMAKNRIGIDLCVVMHRDSHVQMRTHTLLSIVFCFFFYRVSLKQIKVIEFVCL